MLQSIHLAPALTKRLELLQYSGKKAALAAAKAEEIISRLQSGGELPCQVGIITKHGEQRIRGMMKYDLGSGYRLVTFRQKFRIFLLFVGTHDDCHRWIENNRGFSVDQVKKRCSKLIVAAGGTTSDVPEEAAAVAQDKEYDPLLNISERDLRQIFRGLADSL